MKKLTLSRKALFTSVWEKPIKQLASELDLSHSSITTACVILNIPKPESGYWSKVKYNSDLERPSLPEATPDGPLDYDFTPYIQDRDSRRDLEARLTQLKVSCETRSLHPLVIKSKKAFKLAKPNDRKILEADNRMDHGDLKVSKGALPKANLIISILFCMFDELGWGIKLKSPPNTSMKVTINGIDIPFFLKEKINREAYQLTSNEEKRRKRGEFVLTPNYSFFPTDELHLILGSSYKENKKAIFKDEDVEEVKAMLVKFCSSLIPTSRRIMVEDERRNEYQRQYELERKKQRKVEEERENLLAKQQKLEADTEKWHQAERMREFIDAKLKASSSQEVKEWGKWAYEYANSIDPLTN